MDEEGEEKEGKKTNYKLNVLQQLKAALKIIVVFLTIIASIEMFSNFTCFFLRLNHMWYFCKWKLSVLQESERAYNLVLF